MKRRRRPHQRGMTLIEILVVVTILSMIATIVGITVKNAMEDARVNAAKIQIDNFDSALDLYKLKFYRYPSTTEGLAALQSPPRGAALIESVPEDPWGSPYIYQSPGGNERRGYELRSKGSDGEDQTDDDIR
ncbi:MAG: type II secretion system major pseudopilin GspG [Deltaproteobacteria bacterium]